MQKQFKSIILIQVLFYLASGLFAPTWYKILFERGGTIDQFGVLIGLMAIGSVASAYMAGWLAHDRNPFKVLSVVTLIQSLLMVAYLIPGSIVALYILQVLNGVNVAAVATLYQIIVATSSGGRSKKIGLSNSLIQASVGTAMIAGGFVAAQIGNSYTVIVSAFIVAVSAIIASMSTKIDAQEQIFSPLRQADEIL